MHDIRWIRDHPEDFDAGLVRRGLEPEAGKILELDEAKREIMTGLQEMQARRNEVSKKIGAAKAQGEDTAPLMSEVAGLKKDIQELEERERDLGRQIDDLLAGLPNLLAADVPDGNDESDNKELRRVGDPPEFDFEPKQHFELGEALGMMDFEAAARISGARFVVLSGALARLERALGAFMLDVHTRDFGYREVSPPLLVRDEAAFGTGQLPKFADDLFRTTDGLWLISTAEMPVTNLVRGQILEASDLPVRYVALTPCFRSEAGAAGKDTRGMIRQHQFNKVELVSICAPERSGDELEALTGHAEEILKRLDLAYRVVTLCSGDTGFSAHKTYDLEVWLPGQGSYREISSCSLYGDFQARRMDARYRPEGAKGTAFVHTLNGSGLALGRTLIAIMENYQRADGTIAIPEALQPYMGGVGEIGPDA